MDKFLALTGHAAKDTARKWRDLHRSNLQEETAGICASHVPMTWSEFHKALNEAKVQAKLANQKRGKQSPWHNYQGHSYG